MAPAAAPHELQHLHRTCTLALSGPVATMKVSSGEMQALQVFRAQYFQLLDLVQMRWPEAQLLKRPDVQAWLFAEMFDRDSIQYPPPERYQMRVLKRLVSTIEQAIDNPEEDVCKPNSSPFIANVKRPVSLSFVFSFCHRATRSTGEQ